MSLKRHCDCCGEQISDRPLTGTFVGKRNNHTEVLQVKPTYINSDAEIDICVGCLITALNFPIPQRKEKK